MYCRHLGVSERNLYHVDSIICSPLALEEEIEDLGVSDIPLIAESMDDPLRGSLVNVGCSGSIKKTE